MVWNQWHPQRKKGNWKGVQRVYYAINNRILINENLFFWKEELEIKNLLEKETLEIFSRVVEFGRIYEAEKIIDNLFARCISERANIYSLYNAIIQLFPFSGKYYNGCQIPKGEGDISCLILRLICINFIQQMSWKIFAYDFERSLWKKRGKMKMNFW